MTAGRVRRRREPERDAVGAVERVPASNAAMAANAADFTPEPILTVRVPLAFPRRGGRKLVVSPAGLPAYAAPRPRIDSALVKALARAHRWKRLLEDGAYPTLHDLARAEKINRSYLCRVLRLTLLAPDITEAILHGRQPATLQLDQLLTPFPVEWERQRRLFG